MDGWSVMLKGEDFDLHDLSTQFRSPELRITKESDGWFLHASEFDDARDYHEVRDLAHELINRINGVAKLTRSNFRTVKFAGSADYRDGEKHHIYVSAHAEGRSYATASLSTSNDEPVPPTISESRMTICAADARIARAFRLFGYEHTWDTLYKVYEVMEEEFGIKEIRSRWPNGHRLKTFTSTANNRQAVGDAARHGHEKQDPPKNPMQVEEATSLIKGWLEHWLELKKPVPT